MNRSLRMLAIAAVVLTGWSLTGCEDDKNSSSSYLLVTHASPDAPGVDLLIDNQVVGTNLTYPNNTGYVKIDDGMRNVKVNVTGTSTTVINADLNFEKNEYYSVFANDSVSKLGALVLNDDLATPAAGKAHVRFVHLSPNAPAVDITTSTGAVVFGDYVLREASAFTPLDAATYNLEVRLAGTSTVVLALGNITVEAGKIYTIFAKGFVGGAGAQALGAQIIVND